MPRELCIDRGRDSAVNELVYAVRSITDAERRLVMEQQAH